MRRIAVGFLGLLLTAGVVGCEGETATNEPVAPPAEGATADPAADTDADGEANATDEAPADPAAE